MLAGGACADEAFRQLDSRIEVTWERTDGAGLAPGDVVAIVRGPLAPVLTAERTALNFVCHLSGVATLTRRFVDAVAAANPATRSGTPARRSPGCGPSRRPPCERAGA